MEISSSFEREKYILPPHIDENRCKFRIYAEFDLIFLLSADPLSTVPMYADENGSAKSDLIFVSQKNIMFHVKHQNGGF